MVRVSDIFQLPVTRSRWHLFEVCDLKFTPAFIKHACQSMLTAQWTHKLPLIQRASPSVLAAELIRRALEDIKDINDERYTVVDFCSGSGGPIPAIERSVNLSREAHNHPPISFRVSDLNPDIDAWMAISMHSANLSFIPQPVDATSIMTTSTTCSETKATSLPSSVISKSSPLCPYPSSPSATKIFSTFHLSFHHFPDRQATSVISRLLSTTDGFAIIELQDRTLGTLLLIALGEFLLCVLSCPFWFPSHLLLLALTCWIPVVPAVMLWDGVVSCLRTRTFTEMLQLVQAATGQPATKVDQSLHGVVGAHEDIVVAVCAGWRFTKVRVLHTWPFGYMNAVVGHRME